jgi:hypothetical protein
MPRYRFFAVFFGVYILEVGARGAWWQRLPCGLQALPAACPGNRRARHGAAAAPGAASGATTGSLARTPPRPNLPTHPNRAPATQYVVFALFYIFQPDECLSGVHHFSHAMWFSVQTAATIGE